MPFDGAFSPRATGTEGRLLIQAFEGFSPTVYICPAGYPTVGYGHVVLPGERFDQPLSQAEGDALLSYGLMPEVAELLWAQVEELVVT